LERESGLYFGGAALLGILPLLIKGNVAAHDLQFHISSWNEVAQHGGMGSSGRDGQQWPITDSASPASSFTLLSRGYWADAGLWIPIERFPPAVFLFIAFFAAGAVCSRSAELFAAAVRGRRGSDLCAKPLSPDHGCTGTPRCRDAGERRVPDRSALRD